MCSQPSGERCRNKAVLSATSCANSHSGTYANSTRQRGGWLANLAAAAPITAGIDELALVDTDDTIKASYGYQKQGAGYGYSGVKGLNALIGTVTTNDTAPGCARARRIRPVAPPNLWFRNPLP